MLMSILALFPLIPSEEYRPNKKMHKHFCGMVLDPAHHRERRIQHTHLSCDLIPYYFPLGRR